ncbi:hypothetical protein QZH41_004493 [Actinostola sp. cb2023]|nr:hypothetical protein QZH41_004493 [Actinostola sp. cb2023]
MNINSFPVIVSSVDARRKYVKVYYLPYEVQNSDLQAALAEHGHVYNVRRDVGYKGIEDGVRTVTMNVNGNIPSFMKVGKYECKIWYRGQRQTCRKCYSTEHFARDCPNVQCYRCKEMGHVSRNCLQEEYCDRCGQSGHTEWRCRISHYENARASALEQPVSEVLAEEMVEKEPEKEQEQQKQESKESVAMDDLPFGDTDGEEEQSCEKSVGMGRENSQKVVTATFRNSVRPYIDIVRKWTMNINSFPVIVSSVDARRKYVKVYYLPYEVQNSDLQAALAEHGHVYNVRRDVGYKGIEDGVRTVTMNVNGNIPSFMKVGKYECKIWYRGQRQTCRKCYSTEHFARDCPNVQCYRCKEMGHVSRNCLQEEYCDRCGQSGHTEWRCRISHYENARASALEQPVSEVLAEEMVEKEPEKEQEQQKQESKESVAMDDLPFGDTDGEEEQVTSQDGGDIERLKEAEEVTQMEAVQGTAKRQRPPSPLTSPRTKQRKDDKQKEKEDDGEN